MYYSIHVYQTLHSQNAISNNNHPQPIIVVVIVIAVIVVVIVITIRSGLIVFAQTTIMGIKFYGADGGSIGINAAQLLPSFASP